MLSDSVTKETVTMVALYGLIGAIFLVFLVRLVLRRKGWFLPFIDLVSFFLGGVSLILLFAAGAGVFLDAYPRELAAGGLSNEREPYRAIYYEVWNRYHANCDRNAVDVDCMTMGHFLDQALQTMDTDSYFVPYREVPPAGTSAELVTKMQEYQAAYDSVPKMQDRLNRLFRTLNIVPWLVLTFAWVLGLYRRWILFWTAYRPKS